MSKFKTCEGLSAAIDGCSIKPYSGKYSALFIKLSGRMIVRYAWNSTTSNLPWQCQYEARDSGGISEEESLLDMVRMLREDANRIEEFAKSMQNESTNQG